MLTVFGDFLVDGQDLALRLIYHLYIGGHFFCTGTDGYMLAFLYNIHELVVAVTLDCGFKGAYFTAQTAAFDIGDDLIHDPYQFGVVFCLGQYLNCNACTHYFSLRSCCYID